MKQGCREQVHYHYKEGRWECRIRLTRSGREAVGYGLRKREAYRAAYAEMYGPAGLRPAWMVPTGKVTLIG